MQVKYGTQVLARILQIWSMETFARALTMRTLDGNAVCQNGSRTVENAITTNIEVRAEYLCLKCPGLAVLGDCVLQIVCVSL